MTSLALVGGLRLRQFDGESGAVAFSPVSADTHLIGDAAFQVLDWLSQASLPMDRARAVASLLAEAAPDQAAADGQALNALLGELLQAGLLVESTP